MELIDLYESKFPKLEGDDFYMFLCDPDSSDEKQKTLLKRLLNDKYSSAKPWFEYISYLQNSSSVINRKKSQLVRLLSRAMNVIDKQKCKEDKYYLQLVKAHTKALGVTTTTADSKKIDSESSKAENHIVEAHDSETVEITRAKRGIKTRVDDGGKLGKCKRVRGSNDSVEITNTLQKYSGACEEETVEIQTSKSLQAKPKAQFDSKSRDPNESIVMIRQTDRKKDEIKIQIPTEISVLKSASNTPSYCSEDESDCDNDTIPLSSLLAKDGLNALLAESELPAESTVHIKRHRASRRLSRPTKPDELSQVDVSFDCETVALEKNTEKLENIGGCAIDKKMQPLSKVPENKKRVSFGRGYENSYQAVPSTAVQSINRLTEGTFSSKITETSVSNAANGDLPQIYVNGRSYMRVGLLGKGGSSSVYRVLAPDGQLFAYKRVEIRGGEDADSMCEGYVNEIQLLQRLKGSPYIIDLLDAEVNKDQMFISMVMEVGEIDLAKVLQMQIQTQKKAVTENASDCSALSPFFVRMVWQEMLEAVDYIHTNRIVHGDLKPANFVFVKGHLKLIDFGIAKAFGNDTTNIYRDSQIGTINYMAPESICPVDFNTNEVIDSDAESNDGDTVPLSKSKSSSKSKGSDKGRMKMGRASDIWSMGCILYQMLYGRPPFSALSTIQKLQAIPNVKYAIPYPVHNDEYGIETVKSCLQRDPTVRPQIRGSNGLLSMKFLSLTYSSKPQKQEETKLPLFSNMSTSQCQQVIRLVISEIPGMQVSPLTLDAISSKVMSMLQESSNPPNTQQSKSGERVESKTPIESVFLSSSQKSSNATVDSLLENKRPFKNALTKEISNITDSVDARKPLSSLPASSLNQQIMGGVDRLKSVSSSDSSKWMKVKISPEKNMQAVLEKRLQQMRSFIRTDDDNESDDSIDFTTKSSRRLSKRSKF